MTPARKRLAILFVVVGTGLIAARTLASGADADVVAPLEASRPSLDPSAVPIRATTAAEDRHAGGAPPVLRLGDLAKRAPANHGASNADAAALFAVQSWQPPTPAAPVAEAVEPVPPPFPYAYLGGIADETGRTVFFSRGDRVLPIHDGETVDGTYRVEHLDDTSMTLTYIPLQKTVLVAIGGRR